MLVGKVRRRQETNQHIICSLSVTARYTDHLQTIHLLLFIATVLVH